MYRSLFYFVAYYILYITLSLPSALAFTHIPSSGIDYKQLDQNLMIDDNISDGDYLFEQSIDDDPLEVYNRPMFKINKAIDNAVITPVTQVYRVIPVFWRSKMHNFLHNLSEPLRFLNLVLQGKPDEASQSIGRFIINTTAGLGGLHDIAGDAGIKSSEVWMGQTLKHYGFGSGPFIILPTLGPSTVRDTVGLIIEYVADPVNMTLNRDEQNIRFGVFLIDEKDQYFEVQDEITLYSTDEYSTVKSLYLQKYK